MTGPPAESPAMVEEDSRSIELALLLATLALATLIALAGLPGRPVPEAGNGSDVLREGWAARHAAQASITLDPPAPAR